MTTVITYRLAYLTQDVDLCSACVERDDHNAGSLGPVSHGEHSGECAGDHHERWITGKTITDSMIRRLKREAIDHSDYDQSDYCDRALTRDDDLTDQDGNEVAHAECPQATAREICARAVRDAMIARRDRA